MMYTDLNGNPVAADDPKRFLWYGLPQCGLWTDDIDRLKKVGPGIPVCPSCQSPGMQTTAGGWDEGVAAYDKDHPGYAVFIAACKNHCRHAEGGFVAAWERYRASLWGGPS